MMTFFFTGPAVWFGIPAVIGSALFLVRVVLMLVGGAGLDLDFDTDHDGVVEHADSSEAFKVLSIQTLAAFAMGFGWGGLAAYRGSGWPMTCCAAGWPCSRSSGRRSLPRSSAALRPSR